MRRAVMGVLLLNGLLLVPLWLRYGELGTGWVALEALLLVAALALLPARAASRRLAWPLAAVVLLGVLVGLGDAATYQALGRSLNLYLDWPLLRSVYDLLAGTLGTPLGLLAILAGVAVLVWLAWGLKRVLAALPGTARRGPARLLAAATVVASAALLVAQWQHVRPLVVTRAPLVDTFSFQAQQLIATHRARLAFAETLAERPGETRPLPGLAGRDVLLIFVESYGVSALAQPRYAEVVGRRLASLTPRLEAAGLAAVSGTLAAPVRGGQSWLSHATTLSGLWIDNDLWYRLLLDSERPTLVDDFRATGHHTLAVMPAITRAWPEGEAYGFDAIHAAADLDYAGPALNWVTMPDQYTLHRFGQSLRPAEGPVFAQIALISSHAPWTPILPVLEEWQALDDGRVFSRWAEAGESPEVLWQDPERVREHYARAVAYSLEASLTWIAEHVADDSLVILLGDHQSAPLITGDAASDGVPVHVIAGDPALLAPFRARSFVPGLLPPQRDSHPGMHRLRDWLHEEFGS
ncbi:sulfatase-like hydrolase/transferase [Halomonas sp. NO4]|uniref:sulfatase-like hydrolase/transferase n=1 Tax=Halomonas sp. NO4 TaxID=2484813 RepID=UPI0013D89610|nr:sulfatase-like hydrolase/transferase [Halomonas sp. NO4]